LVAGKGEREAASGEREAASRTESPARRFARRFATRDVQATTEAAWA
jgi:hypothetical protein